jgi:eukaryotic-like serine/threonine-protein kinase
VTFADWILYLRALPAAERERRRPKDPGSALGGGTRPDDPYVLTLRPVTTEPPYVVREGQPLRYGKRAVRATVRWERLPVSGISFLDGQAYVAWLASTGRVPGARLCTDFEWERAARGADGRLWSHGNRLDPDDADIDETYGREPLGYGPDEVGSHPRSTSPLGLVDTVGNLWEWVAGPGGIPVQRGGGWYHTKASALSSNRDVGNPSLTSPSLGLRICADAP